MHDSYRVKAEPPLSPPGTLPELLTPLADALNATGHILADWLDELTRDQVELAFNSLAPKERQELLRRVGIHLAAPRRASRSLCRDVLTRMRREARTHGCRCAAVWLTSRVFKDISDVALATDEERTRIAGPVDRWGQVLSRIAVLSWCHASVRDADVLSWAADNGWFGAAKPAHGLRAVEDEALRVAAARPAPAPRPDSDEDQSEQLSARAVATSQPVPRQPSSRAVEETLTALEAAVQTARDAVQRVGVAVTDGRPPAGDDLRALSVLPANFADAQEALAEAGFAEVPRRLAELAQAREAYRAAHEAASAFGSRLRLVLDIHCDEASSAAPSLAAAHERARHLLDRPVWDMREQEQAQALSALVEMVETRDQPDALAGNAERQRLVGQVIPECAAAVLLCSELSIGAADGGGEATAEHGEAVEPGSPGSPSETVKGVREDVQSSAAVGCESTQSKESETPRDVAVPRDEARPPREVRGDAPPQAEAVVEPPPRPVRVPSPAAPTETDIGPDEAAGADASDTTIQDPATVEKALARLVTEGRFGLAAHLSRAAGRTETESATLRFAAIAAGDLSTGNASAVRIAGDALEACGVRNGGGSEGTELLLLPALLRMALYTGEHTAGAHAKVLAARLPEGLAEIAVSVGDRALSGALTMAPPMVVIADVSETEERLLRITEQCRTLLNPPHLRFHRASRIAHAWLAPEGLFGEVLTGIINGHPEAPDKAVALVGDLSRRTDIQGQLARIDRELKDVSGQPVHGASRNALVSLAERVVDCVKSWLTMREVLDRRSAPSNDWAVREISAMRQDLLGRKDQVRTDLSRATQRSGALAVAAAKSAVDSLTSLFDQLEHGSDAAGQVAIQGCGELSEVELLKIPLAPGDSAGLDDLLTAVDRSWLEAVERQVEKDAFTAAYRILDLSEWGVLPGPTDGLDSWPRTRLEQTEAARRAGLKTQHGELAAELRRAQADGALTDDQDVTLQELLATADLTSEDIADRSLQVIRRTLDEVADLLPRYRREAADRLRARLDALPAVPTHERDQVLRHLDTDSLATAADLVYFLELGEPVPEILNGESHLRDFFPDVPRQLSEGITANIVEMVRERRSHPMADALDYSELSSDEAVRAAEALDRWRELSAVGVSERPSVNVRELLLPSLALLGYESKKGGTVHRLPRRRDYVFADITDLGITGRAWAPDFGSNLMEQGGRLRVLLLWGKPSAQLLLSWAAQEPSGESLLVAYFGTLSSEARSKLASESTSRAPIMVLDDAALAYLIAKGNRQASATTETLLPFSGVNPYIKEKRGRIGREMFYGRDAERSSILSSEGTQILFGGRGLGKSALLSDAGDRFVERRPEHHRLIYVNLDHHNIGKGTALGAETVWSVLDQELTRIEVLPQRPRRNPRAVSDPYARVSQGIEEWLTGDADRRLLILMDECDRFFDADTPHCTQTRRLKGLGGATRGRTKVVFAGLHSVQRFTRLARNGPFGHLAQTPTVVGPLAPQSAADLLTLPMRALGFEFADVDLVNRVLGYCSYQPFLLQMFGSRMVEVMQRKRARGEDARPPYAIEAEDVAAVESDAFLRADIRAAFKETLALDDRYNVIANVLAHQARNHGLETRLSDAELRSECGSWWPEGFRTLDSEGFRAYLQEMVGLGVLAPNHDGRGWHLRGPNALRMIGTAQEIEHQLVSADTECQLEATVVMESRPELSDRRVAPLTVTQIDDLLGNHANQTRVVLGTLATGVGDVADTLRQITKGLGKWKLPPIGRPSVFRQELTSGRPGERRVLISDLATPGTNGENCRKSLAQAEELIPSTSGVTRSVVIILGTEQLALWADVLTDPASAVVVLRRASSRSLRTWSQHSLFDAEDKVSRAWEATGGWPVLLDRLVRLHEDWQEEAPRRLSDELQRKQQAREMVAATGLTSDARIAAGYKAIVEEIGTDWCEEEVLLTAIGLAFLDEDAARRVFACLKALQVFEYDDTRLMLEPVLLDCWRRCDSVH